MSALEFSVPYNGDSETLAELFRLKRLGSNRIKEVFLSGPQEYSSSGRITPKMNFDEFAAIVDLIHAEGIRVNLVLNPTCEGIDWYSLEVLKSTMQYVGRVHEELGVEAITMANPLYIKEVRHWFPDIEISASVLGDIDCVQRAIIYSKAGANVITPDVNINRDLGLLKQIKDATNCELKLMVNEGCLYKCPFRKFHFNAISHMSKAAGQLEPGASSVTSFVHSTQMIHRLFFGSCNQVIAEDNSQLLKSGWIRPEDTSKYSEVATVFKIAGRTLPRNAVTRITQAYLNEAWDGDLLDILDSSLRAFSLAQGACLDNKSLDEYGFFDKVTSCDKDCIACSYCEKLASKLVRLGVASQTKREDRVPIAITDEMERTLGVQHPASR